VWARAVALVNARVAAGGGIASSVRFSSRILGVDDPPKPSDAVVDLDGAFVLPGLLNAHDHLELNHFGRVKFRERYENASSWIDDMRPKLRDDASIRAGRSHPLRDRLLVGGLKNLLSGATTVSHHNPFYRELRRGFPVRVVSRYGWAHSFFLENGPVGAGGERGPGVVDAYRRTPRGAPFLLHLAEGFDASARGELKHLRELGCLRENTVLVHGVGLSPEDWSVAWRAGAGLVFCPSSNRYLLGRSARLGEFLDREPGSLRSIALGTDSRLSGARDLLEELREARMAANVGPGDLYAMVTANAASLLRVPSAGRIAPGLPADLLVIPPLAEEPAAALLALARNRIELVTVGGRPLVGAPALSPPVFAARGIATVNARLDSETRLLDAALARRIRASTLAEPGLEL
jgi:cytosine/adenosine deaminase-related metal-dependent hydrolase